MQDRIRLFIGGMEVEQDTDFGIALTYQMSDTYNPTAVKTPYSKTISIKGTPHNNEIFSNYWNPIHSVSADGRSSGVTFNPSKRVEAEIYSDGILLLMNGYVRLDSITRKGSDITYSVTFYSGLGNFFYSLKTDEETGEELTLADLFDDFSFKLNAETVKQAWDDMDAEVASGATNGLITFVPAYEGYPDDFDSDKAVINMSNNHIFTTSSYSGYTDYDGCVIAELNREYDQYEMKDLRSWCQRPAIKVSKVMEAIAKFTDYEVMLDSDFFSSGSPYYNDTWMTLPMISEIDDAGGDKYQSDYVTGSWINPDSAPAYYPETIPTLSGKIEYIRGEILDLSTLPAGDITSYIQIIPGAEITDIISGSTIPESSVTDAVFYDGYFCFHTYQMKAYEIDATSSGKTLLASSQMHVFGGKEVDVWRVTQYMKKNGISSYAIHTNCNLAYNSESGHIEFKTDGEFTPVNLSLQFSKRDNVRIVIECHHIRHWSDDYTGESEEALKFYEKEGTYAKTEFKVRQAYRVTGGNFVLGEESSGAHSNVTITKNKLLGNTCSPYDFLLSLSKTFGLVFINRSTQNSKKIQIVNRNVFFNGEKEDISERIDYGQTVTINPLVFESNWYRFANDIEESEYVKAYAENWGTDVTYGEQRVSTNYNFDSEVKDLYDGNSFRTAVESLDSSICYRDYHFSGDILYPSCMVESAITYDLYEGGNPQSGTTAVTVYMKSASYSDWNPVGGYDVFPKMCFRDSDGGTVDGSNVLLFYRGMKPLTDAQMSGGTFDMFITDDFDAMMTLNDGTPCHLITEDEYLDDGETRIAVKVTSLPSFGRVTEGLDYTLDFGIPKELYVPSWSLAENTGVYARRWKKYIEDQFDLDTKKCTCYVHFKNIIDESALRVFYFFENSYWILNKVTDYNPVSDAPVKCEFIRVKNLSDYTNGQVPN